jgi:hypothetical protein
MARGGIKGEDGERVGYKPISHWYSPPWVPHVCVCVCVHTCDKIIGAIGLTKSDW